MSLSTPLVAVQRSFYQALNSTIGFVRSASLMPPLALS
jgi:hypothetical protein